MSKMNFGIGMMSTVKIDTKASAKIMSVRFVRSLIENPVEDTAGSAAVDIEIIL